MGRLFCQYQGTFLSHWRQEKNRNAVYEALLSNIKLKDSITNTEMKVRIENEHSRLTAKKKEYEIPLQLALAIEEEQKRLKTAL